MLPALLLFRAAAALNVNVFALCMCWDLRLRGIAGVHVFVCVVEEAA